MFDTIAFPSPLSLLWDLFSPLVQAFAKDDEDEEDEEEEEDEEDDEASEDDDSDEEDDDDEEDDEEDEEDDDEEDDDEDSEEEEDDDIPDNPFDEEEDPKKHKAFEKMREKLKGERMSKEDLATLVAQTVSATLQESGLSKTKKTKDDEDDDEVEITEEEEKVIRAGLKKLGIDPDAYRQSQQNQQVKQAIDQACDELETEFKDSEVPFDRKKVLDFARKNKYGVAMPDAPLADVLRIAYRHMNEDKISSSKAKAKKKKKKSKTPLSSSSTSSTPVKGDKKRKTAQDYINSALRRTRS